MLIRIGAPPGHGFDQPLGLLSDCHRRIEHFLGVLTVVTLQARGGPLTPGQRVDLDASLKYFATAAPRHTADEEQSLFPRLRSSADPAAADALATVARLEQDHEEADAHHAAVDILVRRWLEDDRLEPADGDALRRHLAALHDIYEPHIALEDRELFPAAAKLLSGGDLEAIGREMKARRATGAPLGAPALR